MNILIIGGTRNMGHALTLALRAEGHQVTLLNRGITNSAPLPEGVSHLQADRTVRAQLEQALSGRTFDVVVDFVLYNGTEAEAITDILQGKTAHYIFISSGQVYLLRDGLERPFEERDYSGALKQEPPLNTYDHEEWMYGLNKRRAEDALALAYTERRFPYTTLRLPMVNSERDPFSRLYAYILRLKDGGPILVPDQPDHLLRHIYSGDVIQAVRRVMARGEGKGEVFNISQEETLSLEDFLALLGALVGVEPKIVRVERSLLNANGFLPDCSPFSDIWMSELDNRKSKAELGMVYTPLSDYLQTLVDYYEQAQAKTPANYKRRHSERLFAANL